MNPNINLKSWFSSSYDFFQKNSTVLIKTSLFLYTLLTLLTHFLPTTGTAVYAILNVFLVYFIYQIYLNPSYNPFSSKTSPEFKTDIKSLFKTFVIYYLLTLALFLLFIIPGIIYTVYWCLWEYIVLDQKITNKASLNSSKALVSGHWWQVAEVIFLNLISLFVLNFLLLRFIPNLGLISSLIINNLSGLLAVFFNIVLLFAYLSLKKSPLKAPDPATSSS